MKKTVFALLICSASISWAQEETKELKEIRKEVRVENENGVKTVEIITTEGDVVKKEVYTGEDADKKLMELEGKELEEISAETMEIKMEEINGQKRLTVRTEKDGQVEEEVYVGADAEKKLKELEVAGSAPKQMKVKRIERIERVEE